VIIGDLSLGSMAGSDDGDHVAGAALAVDGGRFFH
jgi:hypothetical protein